MKVEGVVIEKREDRYATILVVERAGGMKSDPVAVRCHDRARRAQADDVQQGDRVEIVVEVKSRKYNDRWYTDANAIAISVTGNVRASDSGTQANDPPPPPEEDDIPF